MTYKKYLPVAAVIVPSIMAVIGYLTGDVKPIVRDVCGVFLPGELATPPAPEDAGAPR